MAGTGYDISASASSSSSSGTGGVQFAPVTIGQGIGGSSGFSLTTILIIGVATVAAWFFIRPKKA